MKPKVSEVTWQEFYISENGVALCEIALEDRAFMRVRIKGGRPKYFYGETSYSDSRRYIADNGDFAVWLSLAG
jgi:hypothetical protein